MNTEPIKCLSSVSKVNMGGIRNFPSAVIMPITLPIADSTVICLVQSCFGLLPGLIGFVYADCSFAELFLSFFLVLSLFPEPGSEPTIALLPAVLISSRSRASPRGIEFLGSKRSCCCFQLLCECKDVPCLPLLLPSLKKRVLPRSQAACQRAGSWDLLGMVALKPINFVSGTERGNLHLSRWQRHTRTHVHSKSLQS